TLGNAFLQLGDGRAGAAQYEPARAIYERLLGPDDVNTLAVTNQLGLCYLVPSQGWRSVVVRTPRPQKGVPEAVDLCQQLLPRCRARLGQDHELTIDCMRNLAATYNASGQRDKAEQVLKDVVEVYRTRYGTGHRSTLRSLESLTVFYKGTLPREEVLS